jgi:hypothetical protein
VQGDDRVSEPAAFGERAGELDGLIEECDRRRTEVRPEIPLELVERLAIDDQPALVPGVPPAAAGAYPRCDRRPDVARNSSGTLSEHVCCVGAQLGQPVLSCEQLAELVYREGHGGIAARFEPESRRGCRWPIPAK